MIKSAGDSVCLAQRVIRANNDWEKYWQNRITAVAA